MSRVDKSWTSQRLRHCEQTWKEVGEAEKIWDKLRRHDKLKRIPAGEKSEKRCSKVKTKQVQTRAEKMWGFTPAQIGKTCPSLLWYNIPCWKLPPPCAGSTCIILIYFDCGFQELNRSSQLRFSKRGKPPKSPESDPNPTTGAGPGFCARPGWGCHRSCGSRLTRSRLSNAFWDPNTTAYLHLYEAIWSSM
jgi:hypothetical protein